MELEFTFEEKITREALNDTVRVKLKAQDPMNENNELTLTCAFANGTYPKGWADILGRRRGDQVIVSFGATNHQSTLDDSEEGK